MPARDEKSYRPDPDALLSVVKKEEAESGSGRLQLFFGMAAGVGKTYAMLKAAQERLKEGVDLVVGTVETHGRPETEALLSGLPALPHKKIPYREVVLEEMDLDAILVRKPQLVLVDELAHTNAPGSRHPKRWQDVIELLDAGIDVYSAVNVQHIESRKELVESITETPIRETVPDSILDRASQIILIDVSPSELLKRLREGKVYLGDMAQTAAENFFKEDRLTALREMALRVVAEKVDIELQGLMAVRRPETVWRPTERLMVAVSHSPFSEGLIRTARRLATNLEAPWLALHVDTGALLSEDDKIALSKNLSLARELGAEVVTTAEVDLARALNRIARQRNVTQLVIGRPSRRWLRDAIHGGTLLEQLLKESGTFDVHVLRPDTEVIPGPRRDWLTMPEFGIQHYGMVLGVITGVALASGLLLPFIGYRAVGFLFLLAVLTVSLFMSVGPILFAAVLSALVWDFFFIPPFGTFYISSPDDAVMCVVYLVTAAITGTLTHRIRRREKILRVRETQTQTLYEIVRTIAAERDLRIFLPEISIKLSALLKGFCSIIPSKSDKAPEKQVYPLEAASLDEKERAVAVWAFDHGRPAGWSTDTLPAAEGLYIPLKGNYETVGILVYRPATSKTRLSQEEYNLLSAVAQQLAVSMERQLFQQRAQEGERLKESEKLYQTILHSVSHEMHTPLTTLMGAATALQNEQIAANPQSRLQLLKELADNADRLNRVVVNLLDMSRLSSGTVNLKKDWHDVNDLIAVALEKTKKALIDHKVAVNSSENLPLVRIDFHLFEQALSNLLLNAATYTPPGTTIEISVRVAGDNLELAVSDNGPGVPEQAMPHLFDKFYRVKGSQPGGTGLGLAIVKGVVEAHGGMVAVHPRPEGGLRFLIRLPVEKQPEMPTEPVAK